MDHRPDFLSGIALGAAFRLALPREAMRGLGGARAGAAAGSSLDFLDFREYHPGDDLRRLDWSVYARTDREVVKLYREEVFPRLDIVLDSSRSMDLPGTAKAREIIEIIKDAVFTVNRTINISVCDSILSEKCVCLLI